MSDNSIIHTHNLGYPRIGEHRELKRITEAFWKGKVSSDNLGTCFLMDRGSRNEGHEGCTHGGTFACEMTKWFDTNYHYIVPEFSADTRFQLCGDKVFKEFAEAQALGITLEAQVLDLLRAAGVEQPARLVAPLLSAALDNVLRYGDTALTGPVARGDAGTVAAHLAEISEVAPETRATYVALARATADRALANGMLRPDAAERLLDVLAGREEDR